MVIGLLKTQSLFTKSVIVCILQIATCCLNPLYLELTEIAGFY